eukprot:CAMPEP_0174270978 /NCGR_PEP_ID=MMETSP0439-20130205/46360_1 /TAXON_ID=0 /ORGANISM="Stereomyxa ramosa, Strain Chinc5" /LENGTH=1143 /DNA_ID=CAMNT_0015360679 /DNA_START=77 /DNA_END=3508 /DNA_ORIENTATION=-
MTSSVNKDVTKIGNRYQVGEVLGRGAFGSVYKGLDVDTGQFVALKMVSLKHVPKGELSAIMMEIDLLKNLDHKNIVKYLGYYNSEDNLYIVLEFVENGSLENVLNKFGMFPESLVGRYISQVLEGLHYLHSQGVIHRDIKGANILITKAGEVKVADFGVSTKLGQADGDKTWSRDESSMDNVVGSPYWMAPEIIELSGATTVSDIWSVGCTVIELLTGSPPYFELSPMAALFHIVEDELPPLPEVSPALKDFLMLCFQKDPNLRTSAAKILNHRWIRGLNKVKDPSPRSHENIKNVFIEEKTAPVEIPEMVTTPAIPNPSTASQDVKDIILDYQKVVEDAKILAAKSPRKKKPSSKLKSHGKQKKKPVTKNKKKKTKKAKLSKKAKQRKHKSGSMTIMSGSQSARVKNFDALVSPRTPKKRGRGKTTTGSEKWLLPDLQGITKAVENVKSPRRKKKKKKKRRKKKKKLDLATDEASDLAQKLQNIIKPSVNLEQFVDTSEDEDWDIDFFGAPPTPRETLSPQKKQLVPDFGSLSGVSLDLPNGNLGPAKTLNWDASESDDWGSESDDWGDFGVDFASKLQEFQEKEEEAEADKQLEDDDPFGDGFDDSDSDYDVEEGIVQDELTRMTEQVIQLMAQLQEDQNQDVIVNACDKLISIFRDYPSQKSYLIKHHGVIPIMEMIEVSDTAVIHKILQVVNQIIEDEDDIKENLCMVGAIPSITKFAVSSYSKSIRQETALFVKEMCTTSQLTLQMFVACKGLPVLVEYLRSSYPENKELIWMAIDAVQKVIYMQVPSLPRNDFCRLFAKCNLFTPLVQTLKNILNDKESPKDLANVISDVLLVFSAADCVVKVRLASKTKALVELQLLSQIPHEVQMKLLKVVKNLSMESRTLSLISPALGPLIRTLDQNSETSSASEYESVIIPCLFNLLRMDPKRQIQAAREGAIPHLQRFIQNNNPLKQFVLPIICQMAHRSQIRRELWKHSGVKFFLELIDQEIKSTWPSTVLESLVSWLTAETERVEEVIVNNIDIVEGWWSKAGAGSIAGMLEPLLRIITLSRKVNVVLGSTSFAKIILEKNLLTHPNALVRVNLVKILTSLFENYKHEHVQNAMIDIPGLKDAIVDLGMFDSSILVRKLAKKLERLFEAD